MARKGARRPNFQKVSAGDAIQRGAWFLVHGVAEEFAARSAGVRVPG